MRQLHQSAHFLITVDDELRLVRRTRTDQPFKSIAELELVYQAVLQALDTIDRRQHVLLVDVRRAPARDDVAFEQVIARYTARLYGGFRQVAAITKTAAGRLQVTRLARGAVPRLHTFTDEAAALAFLASSAAEPALATAKRR
jgi:hypothetical protein